MKYHAKRTEGQVEKGGAMSVDPPPNNSGEDGTLTESDCQKGTHITERCKKAPTLQSDKAPTLQNRKAPTNYYPRGLLVVGNGEEELSQLLQKPKLVEWDTRYRRAGVLFLMDALIRKNKDKGFPFTLELAREYIGAIKRPKNSETIQEPMHLIAAVGWLKVVTPAKVGPHFKQSATYGIPPHLIATKHKAEVFLPPKLIEKMENAPARNERRLNRKRPYRAKLLLDLKRVSISDEGRKVIHQLRTDDRTKSAIKQVLDLIDGDTPAKVGVDSSGTITTNLSQCLRELKPCLLIDGEPIADCDMSHAHHLFLPLILENRITWMLRNGAKGKIITDHEQELERLREFLSDGDYYKKWCKDPEDSQEREEKKGLVNMLLNFTNEKANGNGLYKWMKRKFPRTFSNIEDIKKGDHRNISIQLRNFTAQTINKALLAMQAEGLPAIPQTDALLCRTQDKETACREIGKALHEISGVCCKVAGIRYEPSPQVTTQ